MMNRELASAALRAARQAVLTLTVAAVIGSCGGGRSQLDASAPAPKSQPPLELQSLPGVAEPGADARGISVSGPGYQQIPVQHYTQALNFSSVPDGRLEASGLPPLAFALYTAHNFPSDSYPTDIKVTVDSSGQEYWVGLADFETGRWSYKGPFSASAQVELPFAGKPGGLRDFVSPKGRAQFVILAAAGEALLLSGLELGVDGGADGPAAPKSFESVGGNAGVFLRWRQSSDFAAADFLGYQIERAALLLGDFEVLNSEPQRDANFYDGTVDLNVPYRYRVASVDTSGHRSYTSSLIGITSPSTDTPPVLKVAFHDGPFNGATLLNADFSGSYDPDGTPISEYKIIDFSSNEGANGPEEQQSILMQPGCYVLRMEVKSNGVGTAAEYVVKVYPKWNQTPVTVAAAGDGAGSRLFASRMRYLDSGQTIAVFGHDSVSDALVIWTGAPGQTLTPHRVWNILTPESIEEPVMYKGNLVLPLVSGPAMLVLAWNETTGGDGAFVPISVAATGTTRCSAVTDGSTCYIVSSINNAALFDLTITTVLDAPPSEQRPVVGLAAVEAVSAAYNASAGAIDIVYSDGAKVKWLRWDMASQSIADSAELAASTSTCIDVEINPASGEPGVCYFIGGKIRYREFDGAAWGAEELVDNGVVNYTPFDLRFAHGTRYLSAAMDTGNTALYEYDESLPGWVLRNTPAELATGGKDVTILQGVSPDEILLLDRDSNNDVRLLSLMPGDDSGVLEVFTSRNGQGMQLRAAAGSDGLHLVCRDSAGKPYHFKGGNDGTGWSSTALPWNFVSSLDIGAQSDGEVYVSLNNANLSGDYQLEYWNPGSSSFVNEIAPIPGDPDHYPFMGSHHGSNLVGWVCFDAVAGKLTRFRTNQMEGVSSDEDLVGTTPVWRGALAEPSASGEALIYDGMDSWDGKVGIHDLGETSIESQYDIIIGGSSTLDPLTGAQVSGRTLDGTAYLEAYDLGIFGSYLPRTVYAAAQGPFLNLARIETNYLQQRSLFFEGDENPYFSLFKRDFRRTVSVTDAPGATALMLISRIGGGEPIFRWSNYGDWEDLPLPAGITHMNRPELLVGMDGRWYIVYHDWVTNELKCISTQ